MPGHFGVVYPLSSTEAATLQQWWQGDKNVAIDYLH
jgi:hypothetical protein